MRNSKLKYARKRNRHANLCSLVVSLAIVICAIAIPSGVLIQNVHVMAASATSESIVNSEACEETTVSVTEAETTSETYAETTKATEDFIDESVTEAVYEEPVEPTTQEATELFSTNEAVDTSYVPVHITLSDSDRNLLERLVTGEAGSLGYEGCALVAQAVRDSMAMTGITSVSQIIERYQYAGSTEVEATDSAKQAVSYIFDNDGYAVQHRIIYFYAQDLVSSGWHESQVYVTTCANMRFFDEA